MSPKPFVIVLAFVAFISLGLPDGLLGVSWPSIGRDFDVPLDNLGVLAAFSTAGYLAASFLSGAMLRRYALGTVLAASTFLASVALLGYAATPSLRIMVALGFVAGLGGGAIDAGLNAYGATHFSPKLMNWLHAFFGLGTTIGPLVATTVLSSGYVWRVSYLLIGSVQLLLALTFMLNRRRFEQAPSAEIAEAATPPSPVALGATLRRPVVWFGMAVFFVYVGVEASAAQWSFSLLRLGRGVSVETAGLVISLFWGSLMAGRILFGFVADKLPLKQTLRFCLMAAIVGTFLNWQNPFPQADIAGLMLLGFSFGPVFASIISLTPSLVGKAHANSVIGFQVAAAALGGAATIAAIGGLSKAYGLETIGLVLFALSVLLLALYEGFVRFGRNGRDAPASAHLSERA